MKNITVVFIKSIEMIIFFICIQVLQLSMVREQRHGPMFELNRIRTRKTRKSTCNDYTHTVFGQMVNNMDFLDEDSLFLYHRVWKVQFVG